MSVVVRRETCKDTEAIRETIRLAFSAKSHLKHRESKIVDSLRQHGALTISLVALRDEQILGYVAASPVEITVEEEGYSKAPRSIEGWYGLGPAAVHPNHQCQGIGSLLVENALESLREHGAVGCVVLGRPDFYLRFDFLQTHRLRFPGAPRRFLMALPMRGSVPEGQIRYHDAFEDCF